MAADRSAAAEPQTKQEPETIVADRVRPTAVATIEGARSVVLPHPDVCPNCGQDIPPFKLHVFARPREYRDRLNEVFRCGHCKFIFSWREETAVVASS